MSTQKGYTDYTALTKDTIPVTAVAPVTPIAQITPVVAVNQHSQCAPTQQLAQTI